MELIEMNDIEDVIKYGGDLGNTFLLTGLIAGVMWLQNIQPGVAPLFLIVGAFIILYVNWLKKRNEKPKLPAPMETEDQSGKMIGA